MEQAEFENIANIIRRRAVNTALSYSMDSDEAEDIAQDVMLKLWTLHCDIDGCESAEKLAFCISRNMSIDRYRRRRTVPIGDRRNIIDDKSAPPDEYLEANENIEWLMRRIEKLPPAEYQILRLRQVERKDNGEIARLMGIEKTSVAAILSRARAKILKDIRTRMA